MPKNRVEAFTDGVIAIIITVMVLELAPPAGGGFADLWGLRFKFLIYMVSFFTLAVYWNNHHHLFQLVHHVDGLVLWANTFFLFSVSMFPFATSWVGERHLDSFAPEMFYGAVVLLSNVAYFLVIRSLIRSNRRTPAIADVLGRGYYKPLVSVSASLAAIVLAYVWPPLTLILDAFVMVLWIIPDRRIEAHVKERGTQKVTK